MSALPARGLNHARLSTVGRNRMISPISRSILDPHWIHSWFVFAQARNDRNREVWAYSDAHIKTYIFLNNGHHIVFFCWIACGSFCLLFKLAFAPPLDMRVPINMWGGQGPSDFQWWNCWIAFAKWIQESLSTINSNVTFAQDSCCDDCCKEGQCTAFRIVVKAPLCYEACLCNSQGFLHKATGLCSIEGVLFRT